MVKTAGGGTKESYAGGATVNRSKTGAPTHFENKTTKADHFDAKGRPTQFTHTTANGGHMQVSRVGNERRVETTRTVRGGVEHVVNYGPGRGYVERPIVGRAGYVQRSVIVGGVGYGVVYHQYYYGGVMLYSPVPAVVFAPAYYGWLLTPWARPVYYTPAYWGWAGSPWYGYYGAYFTPYQAYAGPDQWLTDYIISANLQAAYESRQAAAAEPGADPDDAPLSEPKITDDEKALIAQDIHDELARQQQQAANPDAIGGDSAPAAPQSGSNMASQPTPEALRDHLFTVYAAPTEVTLSSGGTCSLAMGDMLFRTGNSPNPDNTVNVTVKSSHANAKHPELCQAQSQAKVNLADLQEMSNHKKELLAAGEKKQAEQATAKKSHLPKAPKPEEKQVAMGTVDPDTQNAVDTLKKQMSEAKDTEVTVSQVTVTAGS